MRNFLEEMKAAKVASPIPRPAVPETSLAKPRRPEWKEMGESETASWLAGSVTEPLSIAVDEALREQVRHAVDAARTAGDYRHHDFGDVARAALSAYLTGMALTARANPGRKLKTTLRVTPTFKAEIERRLTRKARSEVIERAVRSFLKRGLSYER